MLVFVAGTDSLSTTASTSQPWQASPTVVGGSISDIVFIGGRYIGVGAAPAPIEQDPDFPIWDGAVWVCAVR